MIFDSNTTSLSNNIAIAEGYDCSYGAAKALVENARNDYKMFEAMLKVEAREIGIMNESSGYMIESELISLAEAAGGSILDKLKEMFTKLIAKIKAIFHTFMSKINSLFLSDKQMVKKYEKEIIKKSSLGKMQIKWRKKLTDIDVTWKEVKVNDLYTNDYYDKDTEAREQKVIAKSFTVGSDTLSNCSSSDLHDELMEKFLDDEEEGELQDLVPGGIRSIMDFLRDSQKTIRELEKNRDKTNSAIDKVLKGLNDMIKENEKTIKAKGELSSTNTTKLKKAGDIRIAGKHSNIGTFSSVENTDNYEAYIGGTKLTATSGEFGDNKLANDYVQNQKNAYDTGVTLQSVILTVNNTIIDATKLYYKYNKKAFMQAIAANDEKLRNESAYLDAVAEAAEDEVDDIMNSIV